jgi:dTDP-4-dehydrorhamnose reductase
MIERNTILFTGGNGLLGSEFKKQLPNAIYVDLPEFDVTNYNLMDEFIKNSNFKLIIHAAAFTSPPKIDTDPLKAIDVNIIGTSNVVKICMKNNIKLIYLSTDYVFKGDKGNYKEEDPVYPVNKYAISKLGGECAVRLYDNALIIRTSFGPNIFPFPKAFVDQWTTRVCVAEITKKIISLIDCDATGILHVGGKRQTVFQYAKSLDETKDIQELSLNEVNFIAPVDTSLDCSIFNNLINKGLS